MNFKEFFEGTAEEIRNERRKTGLYVSAKLHDDSENELHDWISKQEIEKATITPIKDYHCTVIYSRSSIPKEEWVNEIVLYRAKSKNLRIFPYDKTSHCLVLEIKSPSLEKLHKDLVTAGAKHGYPDYIPHITLAYNINSNFDFSDMGIPDFELIFTEIKSERLDLDWASK